MKTTPENLPTSRQGRIGRRAFLSEMRTGLGGIALACLLGEDGPARADAGNPLVPRSPHFPVRAKRVIQIFCPGAASQIDLWEYKPELEKRHGQPMPGLTGVSSFQGGNGNLLRSPWGWKPYGQSGKYLSELVPHLAECVDDIAFVHSLTARSNTHGPAMLQMNTGFVLEGFPSIGAWLTFALGTENRDLPAFVAIPDGRGLPPNGPANWSAGFLPAAFQGTSFNTDRAIANLDSPKGTTPREEKRVRDFLQRLNDDYVRRNPGHSELAARIASYQLAARMQLSAPEVTDLSRETAGTLAFYGADSANPLKASYAKNCILARRLIERGVRFVQLYCGACASGVDGLLNWDAHKTLKADYERHCPILDQPTAALLKDLKRRGLLDDTLVIWTTEFGRMPTSQVGSEGRDHNPYGFTAWMAGAGVKGGFSYGATDEFGYRAEKDVCTIYDFHATVLRLLGLDHTRLTYYHNGSQRRLTDVHGEVIAPIIA
ncbi:MAG: DUF1501 domain-containing protein [Capsulimonadales bacterium]|nr:DUF1501 domain-containing protein [Capsulimonadales bacterium]